MGRRKIEIKAIKDDRNRSVTFLKRKGGLFKKAHELAVLCSVDVAVIIFGHNKKLYEFSSGNINETLNRYSYVCQTYGGPHEHKGPEDFAGKGKGGDSDDEDDDAGSPRPESHSPPQPSLMQHHLQNQPAFQHLGTPSASPPLQNGQFHRGPSPGPQNISRPGSRTHFRQPSAHLVPPPPHHLPQYSSPQPPQGQFTHMAHPPMPMYSQQAGAGAMQVRPPSNPPHPSQFAYAQPPTTVPPQMQPQYMPPQQVPPQIQIQQAHPQSHAHVQEQRRQSMPQQPERLAVQIPEQAPPAPPPPSHSPPPPQPQEFHSPPLPQPRPLPSAVTHSIFTPIEASSSFLAQHFGKPSTSSSNDVKEERSPPDEKPAPSSRSLSIDTAMGERKEPNGIGLRPPIKVQPPQAPTSNPGLPAPQRTNSTPILNGPPQPPSRTNSLGPARPRLKVQIPAEQSDEEGASKKSGSSGSPRTNVAATLTPIRENNIVHLPPPSPSASALLSAGATGPPNPFARPAPPTSTANGFRGELDTPMSALPSRFMSDQFLPSPSGFYSDFSFSRDNNMLPSPLAFPTPMNQNGPSFKDDEADKKRKMSDSHDGNADKKVKV